MDVLWQLAIMQQLVNRVLLSFSNYDHLLQEENSSHLSEKLSVMFPEHCFELCCSRSCISSPHSSGLCGHLYVCEIIPRPQQQVSSKSTDSPCHCSPLVNCLECCSGYFVDAGVLIPWTYDILDNFLSMVKNYSFVLHCEYIKKVPDK